MKISIIVPVYNTEKYLEQCLNSLINQTFNDVEIICVNDGSTDNSLNILKKYKNIKIINQENLGLSIARNNGIAIAQGEYIAFVDSDDWVDLNFLEKLYSAIKETNSDIACASILRGKNKYRVRYNEQKVYSTLEEKIKICNFPKCSYVWNKLYKAEIIKNIQFKEQVYFEDMIWTPQVLKKSNKMVVVPNTKYYYRRNSNSIVKKLPSEKKQLDFYNAKKEIIKFFDENNIKIKEKNRYITKRKYYLFKLLILKIKEYRYNSVYCLFGFIPFITITRYPRLAGGLT